MKLDPGLQIRKQKARGETHIGNQTVDRFNRPTKGVLQLTDSPEQRGTRERERKRRGNPQRGLRS
jgi:hypothetical protein